MENEKHSISFDSANSYNIKQKDLIGRLGRFFTFILGCIGITFFTYLYMWLNKDVLSPNDSSSAKAVSYVVEYSIKGIILIFGLVTTYTITPESRTLKYISNKYKVKILTTLLIIWLSYTSFFIGIIFLAVKKYCFS